MEEKINKDKDTLKINQYQIKNSISRTRIITGSLENRAEKVVHREKQVNEIEKTFQDMKEEINKDKENLKNNSK
jgi:hypothetical protein